MTRTVGIKREYLAIRRDMKREAGDRDNDAGRARLPPPKHEERPVMRRDGCASRAQANQTKDLGQKRCPAVSTLMPRNRSALLLDPWDLGKI